MLRKCKTVIATIVVTVMMFSVFSYAGSTGDGTQERIMEDAGASVQQQAAAGDNESISAGIIEGLQEDSINKTDDKVTIARS